MKKVLITGKNGYISQSLETWLITTKEGYTVDLISLRDDKWKNFDFSPYDVIVHTVGIAHVDSNPNENLKNQYYKINRDLAIQVAKKAKEDGVSHFIFLSSIIVYGNKKLFIINTTSPEPENFYGNSKLEAEKGIKAMEDEKFSVALVRLPMVYGKGSKGNYPKLAKVAQKSPVFPDIDNQRSMLHIDNLCEFIRLVIVYEESGTFFPQNSEYVKTSEMIKLIGEVHEKKIRLTKIFNPFLRFVFGRTRIFNKVFGNLVYEMSMSEYKYDYRIKDLRQSVYSTEKPSRAERNIE